MLSRSTLRCLQVENKLLNRTKLLEIHISDKAYLVVIKYQHVWAVRTQLVCTEHINRSMLMSVYVNNPVIISHDPA